MGTPFMLALIILYLELNFNVLTLFLAIIRYYI
jgi:hypothetical protein